MHGLLNGSLLFQSLGCALIKRLSLLVYESLLSGRIPSVAPDRVLSDELGLEVHRCQIIAVAGQLS